MTQVYWWDEVHKKAIIARIVNPKKDVIFPRNTEGQIDTKNGLHADISTNYDPKFKKEAHFLAGVSLILDKNGNCVGKNLHCLHILVN